MSTEFLGPSSGGQGPDMKRLLLAVVLMTGILMVYSSYFGPKVPEEKLEQVTDAAPNKNVEIKGSPVLNNDLANFAEKAPNIIATATDIPLKIEKFSIGMKDGVDPANESALAARGGYLAAVSNQGAQIVDFQLVGYKVPIELGVTHAGINLFAVESRESTLTLPVNSRYEVVSSSSDRISLQYMTEQGVRVLRNFKFNPDQFMIEQEVILKNESKLDRLVALNILMNTEESTENKSSGFFSQNVESASVVWSGSKDGATERETVAIDAIEKTKEFVGKANYVGFDKRYFLVALIPDQAGLVEKTTVTTWSETVNDVEKKGAILALHEKPVILKPGDISTFSYSSYLGPKQLSLLRQAGHGLDENINFGWFGVISRPLLWLLGQIYGFVGNFGIAIILLTLLIKLATFPLTQKSFVSMQQMKKINPEVKELQKKYSHDRTLLSQKQMELYKEKGVNPAAGCLPMLIQMPVWFALYQMLWNSVELYQQPFILWITDLTAPDPYYVLPVAMGITMYIQQAFQPAMEDQPQMKYVMWGMPIFFTFIMLKMPAGLSLYIFINNILTIFQQLLIKRRYDKIDCTKSASSVILNQTSKGTRSHGFKK